jgi:hypothetical protein
MKGSSLPINTLIIIIIAIVVLSVVLLFFFGIFTPGTETIQAQQVIATTCAEYATRTQCQGTDEFISQGTEGIAEADVVQESRRQQLVNLASACRTTGIGVCDLGGFSQPGNTCLNICCATFCGSP